MGLSAIAHPIKTITFEVILEVRESTDKKLETLFNKGLKRPEESVALVLFCVYLLS